MSAARSARSKLFSSSTKRVNAFGQNPFCWFLHFSTDQDFQDNFSDDLAGLTDRAIALNEEPEKSTENFTYLNVQFKIRDE